VNDTRKIMYCFPEDYANSYTHPMGNEEHLNVTVAVMYTKLRDLKLNFYLALASLNTF
jgi:hypothetical protein